MIINYRNYMSYSRIKDENLKFLLPKMQKNNQNNILLYFDSKQLYCEYNVFSSFMEK